MNRLTIIFRTSNGCDRSNIAGSREGEVQSEEKKSWSGAAIGSSGEVQGRIAKGLEAAKLDQMCLLNLCVLYLCSPSKGFLSCLTISFL